MTHIRQSIKAGERIRVLVVDDSVVIRRLISRIEDSDPSMELAGVARNGVDALARIAQLKPHIVTLDVEMPELDGIGALREIVERHPEVRVIMFSGLTAEGAETTVEALMEGASDYITKPQSGEPLANAFEAIAEELRTKVKQFFAFEQPPLSANQAPPSPRRVASFRTEFRPEVFAIGVSTGGPSALAEVLPMIPTNFPLPIAIVQHMPPYFTKLLAERLTKLSDIPIVEGKDGMVVEPGCAVIAPGNYHMRLVRSDRHFEVRLNQEEQENSCRPAVDVLFRSIAESCNGRAIAAVLTGMGQDGLLGARQ